MCKVVEMLIRKLILWRIREDLWGGIEMLIRRLIL